MNTGEPRHGQKIAHKTFLLGRGKRLFHSSSHLRNIFGTSSEIFLRLGYDRRSVIKYSHFEDEILMTLAKRKLSGINVRSLRFVIESQLK